MAILSYSKVKYFWVLILENFMVLVWQFCPFQNWQSLGQGEIPKGSVHKEYSYIGRIVRKRRGGDGGVCPLPWIRKIMVSSKAFHQSIFVFEITSLAAQGALAQRRPRPIHKNARFGSHPSSPPLGFNMAWGGEAEKNL